MDLSIIVPIYNVEDYLDECLKSIYKIKNLRYEVILVNDGSKDKSDVIIERFKEKYPEKTVVITKENGGLSSARNAGLRVAKGKYVSFIDSDDFIDPDEFSKFVYETITSRLDIGVGNMRYYIPGKIGDPLFRSRRIKDMDVVTGTEFLWGTLQQPKCFREEVVDDLYNKNFLIKNNLYFNESIIHEDSEFTTLAYLKAKKVKFIDRTFYFYRQREGSIMNKVSEKSVISLEKICDTLYEKYKDLDDIGKKAVGTLILSFYSVILYRRYNGLGRYKEAQLRYRELYKVLKKSAQINFEYRLLNFSVAVPNFLRRLLGKEITNVQKVPKF